MEDRTKKLMYAAGAVVVAAVIGLAARAFLANKVVNEQKSSVTPTQPNATSTDEENAPPLAPTTSQTVPVPIKTSVQPMPDTSDGVLKRTALDFVARFGTYSTDAPNQNLKQLLPQMTGSLRIWAEKKIVESPKLYFAYQGVTTRALAVTIISQNSQEARVEVKTQRVYNNAAKESIEYEIATVHLLVNGASWLIESVDWKKIQ